MTIQDYIRTQAEEKYPMADRNDENLSLCDMLDIDSEDITMRRGFTSGAELMASHAVKFAEWLGGNSKYWFDDELNTYQCYNERNDYLNVSTDQLLLEYLNTTK